MTNFKVPVLAFVAAAMLCAACGNDQSKAPAAPAAPAPQETAAVPAAAAADTLAAIERAEAEVLKNAEELKKALDALK